MKAVVFLGDGMADRPVDELAGMTPLEKASTPPDTSASTATPKPCSPFRPKLCNTAYMDGVPPPA